MPRAADSDLEDDQGPTFELTTPADRAALVQVEFFLPLPFDCGKSRGGINRPEIDPDVRGHGRIPGWEDFTLHDYLGFDPLPDQGIWPTTAFYFRRVIERVHDPLRDLTGAFADILLPSHSRLSLTRTRMGAKLRTPKEEVRVSRTALRLVRIASPPAPYITRGWMREQYDLGMRRVSDFMVALGWAANDPAIGAIHQLDLPYVLAGFQTDLGAALTGGDGRREPFLFLNHRGLPVVQGEIDESVMALAMHLVPDPSRPRPFMPVGEAFQAAIRSFSAGRVGQAVLEAGTSVELLVSVAVRELAPFNGYNDEKLDRVLGDRLGFKNRLIDHMGPLLEVEIDIDDRSAPFGRWWADGYLLRNRVAHRGYRPGIEETARALDAAANVSDWVGRLLGQNPHVADRFGALPQTTKLFEEARSVISRDLPA